MSSPGKGKPPFASTLAAVSKIEHVYFSRTLAKPRRRHVFFLAQKTQLQAPAKKKTMMMIFQMMGKKPVIVLMGKKQMIVLMRKKPMIALMRKSR